MDLVSFPNLGINLNINKVAFELFGLEIRWYAIIIVLGIMAAIFVASLNAKNLSLNKDIVTDMALFIVIAGIIGARLYYVIFSWDIYKNDIMSIFNLRQGGIAIYGAIIGGAIAVIIYSKIKKINTSLVFDGIMTPEIQANIESIISGAIGYNPDRGDTISIVGMEFTEENLVFDSIYPNNNNTLILIIASIGLGLGFLIILILLKRSKKKAKNSKTVVVANTENETELKDNFEDEIRKNQIEETTPENKLLEDEIKTYDKEKPQLVMDTIKTWIMEDAR